MSTQRQNTAARCPSTSTFFHSNPVVADAVGKELDMTEEVDISALAVRTRTINIALVAEFRAPLCRFIRRSVIAGMVDDEILRYYFL